MLNLIVFFLSGLLYLFAPDNYSYTYSLLLFFLFLISVKTCISEDIKDKFYLSFNILFSLSFFLTTYAYPIFIIKSDAYLFGMKYVNTDLITKSTALAQFAFATFALSYGISEKKKLSKNRKIIINFPFNTFRIYSNMLSIFVGIVFFYSFLKLLSTNSNANNYNVGYASTIIISILLMLNVVKAFYFRNSHQKYFFSNNTIIYVVTIIVFGLLMMIGDRGLIITVSVLIISTYVYYVKKIKFWKILTSIIFATAVLFFIGFLRNTEHSIRKAGITGFIAGIQDNRGGISNKWDYLSDLTSISRNLYEGYEYTTKNEEYYPGKLIIITLSPIPFLPTILSNIFYDKSFGDLSSGWLLTRYTESKMSNVTLRGGLGTHCVIDAYLSWGILGTLMMFGLLGYATGFFRRRIDTNIYYAIAYFTLVAYALYIPRSTVYVCYDLIIKQWILFYLIKLLLNKHVIKHYLFNAHIINK